MAEQEVPSQPKASLDTELIRHQYGFTGQWLPDVDPIKIGAENFSDISNLRYVDDGVIGVKGYTRINITTALTTYLKGRSGFQLRTPFTVKSIVLIQAWNAAQYASEVYQHLAVIPNTGDFESTRVHADAPDAQLGYFAEFPNGHVIYNNSLESRIWAGPEMVVAAIIRHEGLTGITPTNPVDFTSSMRNTIVADNMVVTHPSDNFLFASTRPLIGLKLYSESAYTATTSIKYWDGSAFTAVSNPNIPATGIISFDSTVSLVKPVFIDGMFLYFYNLEITAGSATIYHITVNAPFQAPVDLWDGVYRACIQFQASRTGVYEDWTAEVYDSSSAQYPIGAKVGGLTASDHIIAIFDERTTAIKLSMIASKTNTTASTWTIYYWNGSTWVTVGTVYDGTLDSGKTKTLAQSGFIYWDAPAKANEHSLTLFNVSGYAYKLVPSGTLTDGSAHDGTTVDIFYGIPAPRVLSAFKFGFMYRNRPFLAGDLVGKEGNALEFGIPNSTDVYNGADSSQPKRLYIDGLDEVTCGTNIFNRFGSNIYDSQLMLKRGEAYLLNGESPEDYKVYCISRNIGCPAPRTLDTAEIAFEIAKDAIRNIALWMSARGPILFDAATIVPIKGVNRYFDQNYPECINWNKINKAHGWFDPNTYEYNLCIPSGISAVDCNVWLMYDLLHKKWSKRDTGISPIPQATFKVTDEIGRKYIYGLTDNGRMIRLENGDVWDGQYSIQATVTTGDFFPTNSIFDVTCLRRVKMFRETQAADLSYTRTDFIFSGYGIAQNGNLQVFDEVIEDAGVSLAHWDGDNYHCKEIIENGGVYGEVSGTVTITGEIKEEITASINVTGGDFSAQGFIPGLTITTNDPICPGPYILTGVSTPTLTLSPTGRFPFTVPAASRTIYAQFIRLYHYADGAAAYTELLPGVFTGTNRFQETNANCNITALTHKLKFSLFSTSTGTNMRPIVWGYQAMHEREDIN